MLPRRIAIVVIALLVAATGSAGEEPKIEFQPWATCTIVEYTGGDCAAGEEPLPFEEYLHIGPLEADWEEIGRLGPTLIRAVVYPDHDRPPTHVLLGEKRPGFFAPLLKWTGDMPEPTLHGSGRTAVLVISKDYGGNIPMVATWAWVWSESGPTRLDVDRAVHEAIQKVAPGHGGYATGLDWQTLHCRTWTWKGKWPGKIHVKERVDAWFKLESSRLVPTKVEFRKGDEKRSWP